MAMRCVSDGECVGCGACQEREVVFTCANCGDDIYGGADCFRIGCDVYCDSCVAYEKA